MRITHVLAVAFIALVLAASGDVVTGQGTAGTVHIVGIDDLTGPAAQYGIMASEGFKLAIAQINIRGGILGKKIDFTDEDTASDKAQAVAIARRYGEQPDVVALVGITATGELIPIAPVAAQFRIVAFSTGSAGIWPTEFNDWTFRNTLVSDRSVPYTLKLMRDKLHIKSLAVLYDTDNDFNVIETKFVQKEAPKYGIKLVAVESHRVRDVDFSPQLTKIMALNPDGILVESRTNEGAGIVQQARQRGYKGHLVGGTTFSDPTIFKLAGKYMDGVIFNQGLNIEAPRTQAFLQLFQKAYNGALPAKEAFQSYDGIYMLADAMKRANSTTDRGKIRDALGATKNFIGVGGTYGYAGKGDNTDQRVFLYAWKADGTYALVK